MTEPLIASLVLAAIRDVCRDGVDPIERVQGAKGRRGARIRRRLDLENAILPPEERVHCEHRPGDVTGQPLELLSIFIGDDLPGEDRKAGMDLRQQGVHEALREPTVGSALEMGGRDDLASVISADG
jgi:hypothetical protein